MALVLPQLHGCNLEPLRSHDGGFDESSLFVKTFSCTTSVVFDQLNDDLIQAYIDSGGELLGQACCQLLKQ